MKEKAILEFGPVSKENKGQNEKNYDKVVNEYINLQRVVLSINKDRTHKRVNIIRRRLISRHFPPFIALVSAVYTQEDRIREVVGLTT